MYLSSSFPLSRSIRYALNAAKIFLGFHPQTFSYQWQNDVLVNFYLWNWIQFSWEMLCYAKSLQSCPILCDPIDGSPPGSPVPGILQARTLEWAAISFSNWAHMYNTPKSHIQCNMDDTHKLEHLKEPPPRCMCSILVWGVMTPII